jgi:hypothetical protein
MVRADLVTGTPWVMIAVALLVGGGLVAFALQKRGLRLRALAVDRGVEHGRVPVRRRCWPRTSTSTSRPSADRASHGDESHRAFRPGPAVLQRGHVRSHGPFYLGRTVTLVREQGELAWGIANAPRNYIATIEEFERALAADADAYAIMTDATYDELRRDGLADAPRRPRRPARHRGATLR